MQFRPLKPKPKKCKTISQQLTQIDRKLRKIMAKQDEEAAALQAVKAQLTKAKGEIVAKIDELTAAVEAAGNTTPEVDQATQELKELAQGLDDVVSDAA